MASSSHRLRVLIGPLWSRARGSSMFLDLPLYLLRSLGTGFPSPAPRRVCDVCWRQYRLAVCHSSHGYGIIVHAGAKWFDSAADVVATSRAITFTL